MSETAATIADDAASLGIGTNVGNIDRRTYIGGSDVAALLGLDPYGKTPLTVYLAKIGELAGNMDPAKKKFLERRKRWEEPIVHMLREEFDGEIVGANNRYVDPEHPFLAAEIDFEWRDPSDGSIQNGEIKTVSPFAFGERSGWGEAGTDEIPVHYHAQVMHGLGVTGRRTTIVCAMVGLDSMVFYRVDRDDAAIAAMRETCVRFWRENVEARHPPEPITSGDLALLYNRRKGHPVVLDDEHAQALADLRLARAQMDALKGTAAELELKVGLYISKAWGPTPVESLEDNAVLIHAGQDVGTWAAGRGAHLDQKALKAANPDLVKQFTVPHYFRAFRFRKVG